MRVVVQVDQRRFILPVDPNKSIQDLISEAQKRWRSMSHSTDTITELQFHGSMLFPGDTINDVVNEMDEVNAIISSGGAGHTPSPVPTPMDSPLERLPGETGNCRVTVDVPGRDPVELRIGACARLEELQAAALEHLRGALPTGADRLLLFLDDVPLVATDAAARARTLAQWGIPLESTLCGVGVGQEAVEHATDRSMGWEACFYSASWDLYPRPTRQATALFLSTLCTVASHRATASEASSRNLLASLRARGLSGPAVLGLRTLFRKQTISRAHKAAVGAGLAALFRTMVPESVADAAVFEHARTCWAAFLHGLSDTDQHPEESYRDASLVCPLSNTRLADPVRVARQPESVFSRASVLPLIERGAAIHGITGPVQASELQPAHEWNVLLAAFPSGVDTVAVHANSLYARHIPVTVTATATATTAATAATATVPGTDGRSDWSAAQRLVASVSVLNIVSTLRLSGSAYPVLTHDEEGLVGVCTGPKESDDRLTLLQPLHGRTVFIDPTEYSTRVATATAAANEGGDELGAGAVDDRPPEEAIAVLLDISGSMGSSWESGMRRIDAVKAVFQAFANRSMAYQLPHAVSLLLFSSRTRVICPFTRLFARFKAQVETASHGGCTALFDCAKKACDLLSEVKTRHPNARRRILVLTDGEDNESTASPLEVAYALRCVGVTLDAVILGPSEQQAVRALAKYSGGYCFRPPTHAAAVRIFELETVLAARDRGTDASMPVITQPAELDRYADLRRFPYDVAPRRPQPGLLARPVTTPRVGLQRVSQQPPPHASLQTPSVSRMRRIMRELQALERTPHPNFRIYPCEEQMSFWKLLLTAPPDTPYADGVFLLYARFPDSYPAEAPEVRFVTPVHHCNINQDGRICHSVFTRNWTQDTTVHFVLSCVFGLFITPEPEDPLDTRLAEEYFADRAAYDQTARTMTAQHAGRSLAEWERDLVGETGARTATPAHLICPLTQQLFTDPVVAPSGFTYDRPAVLEHLRVTASDPQTGAPLQAEQLIENRALRTEVERFHRMSASAWWNTDA
eukprot:gnl/Trimastix_PCT/2431.p1 GENE.gnl/Trimastix_PCT/2431~~gnl/Trimastix_PCT/2431.p1  ORF type:complete len:1038 (+),score=346.24 gnl/Trimastix_PCT/2431:1394-4507(+)